MAQWIELQVANQTLPVGFLFRARACVVGQIPGRGCMGGNQSMFLSHIDVSLFFLSPSLLSLKKTSKENL